jgi:hypothetical protein
MPDPSTRDQWYVIAVALAEQGYNRPGRLAWLAGFLGRPVGAFKDLTRDEAARALAELDRSEE